MEYITVKDILKIIEDSDAEVDPNELDPGKRLTDQGLDSLDMMNIYFSIEELLKVKLDFDDVSYDDVRWSTIEGIVERANEAECG